MPSYTRRSFLTTVLTVVGLGGILSWKLPTLRLSKPPLTIAQIIDASFNVVRDELRGTHLWANPDLNAAQARGDIVVAEWLGVEGLEQTTVPIVWSEQDETRNPTEANKIALAQSLMVNGLLSHEDVLLDLLTTHRLTVCRKYVSVHYGVVGHTYDGNTFWVCKLYTAYIKTPREVTL